MMFNRLTVAMVIWGCFVFTQSPCQDVPKLIPASPNAATLGKYGDIPVSLYSGTADITVPLYEIRSGDISVPITLSYHTGGIRMNELAGWTGLGFAFNAGGVISRNILGFDDLRNLGPTARPEVASKGSISPVSIFYGSADVTKVINSSKGEQFSFQNIFGTMEAYDLEYDIFSYNFLGRSGQFIVNHAGQPVLQKEEDIRIELWTEDNYPRFKVTDEQGFVYYFKAIEVVTTEAPIGTSPTSWYLSRIESPKGYAVDFAYNAANSPQVGQLQESSTMPCNSSPSATVQSTLSSLSYSNALVLDSITFENGSVDVLMDNVREDYIGQKITGLKVRSKATGNVIKEVGFEYDYFLKKATGQGVQYKRLKLLSVIEKANGISIPPYQFSYNEPEDVGVPQFMYIGSYSVDHWGYYNRIANTGLLPKFAGTINLGYNGSFQSYEGANRAADPGSAARAFSLRQIIYPTGGRTELDLETNTYNISYNEAIQAPEPEIVPMVADLFWTDGGAKSGTIDLTKAEGSIAVSIGFMPNNSRDWAQAKLLEGKVWVEIGSIHHDISGDAVHQDCSDDEISVCSLRTEYLSGPGVYSYSGFIDPTAKNVFSTISIHLSWMEKRFQQTSNADKVGYGGGLRVSAIRNYDEKGNKISEKSYNYHYQDDVNGDGIAELHSYGRQISVPLYTRYDVVAKIDETSTGGFYCASFSRYSNSVMPLTTSVGYDQVYETVIDYTDRNQNTRSLQVFENKPDSVYNYSLQAGQLTSYDLTGMHPFGAQNVSYKTNGLLKSKTDYVYVNGDYKPIRETYNDWSNTIKMNYYSLKHEYFMIGSGTRLVMAYPALRSERAVLNGTVTTLYDLQNNTAITTSETFGYGQNHTQQVRHTSTESTGRTVTEYKIYPPDYLNLATTDGGIKLLQDKHIISAPVEEYVVGQDTPSAPGKVLKANITTYKTTAPLPDAVYRMESATAPPLSGFTLSNSAMGTFSKDARYKPVIQFINYSSRGNVKQMAKNNNVNFAYTWQYNESYPTVECQNCAADKYLYEGFEETASNVSTDARTGYKSFTNVYTVIVPDAGPYTLTYWQKVGSGNWQLIQVNNVTSNKAIGGSGTYIDEVRLFPAGARMTTYTYDPLIGMTSMTDPNNITVYYEYDSLQRLTLVRDQDGNIVKRYTYNYFLK